MADTTAARRTNERTAALLNEIRARANEAQDQELVARINAEVELWGSRETTLVVVGETNRGKSTLVNAILGTDELLPADSRVATEVYIVVRYGLEPAALVHVDGRKEPVRVAVNDVGRWATARSGDGPRVRGVEIRLPHPLLEDGLVLVDTPGVGGLDTAHGRVTLATLRRADALLFVTDPDAPLSAPELEFLEQATERVDMVVFALTKTDTYRGWRRVLDDDRRLLAEHAPRFADGHWCAVSGRMKLMADELERTGTPDATLADESGVPALTDTIIANIAHRTALLRLANLLRLADNSLENLRAAPAAALKALEGTPEAQGLIERDTARLEELRDGAERAQLGVSDQFNLLRELVQSDLNKYLRVLAEKYESDPKSARTAAELVAAIEAELHAVDLELAATIEQEAIRILGDATTLVGASALDAAVAGHSGLGDLAVGRDVNPPGALSDPTTRMRIASALTSTGTTTALAMKYMESGNTMIAGLMGVGVLLGLATTVISARMGRKQRDIQTARTNVHAALEQCRSEAGPRLRQAVVEVQREVEAALRGYVRADTKRLQASVSEAQQVLRADLTKRQQIKTDSERRVALLERSRVDLQQLQSEVAAALRS